MIADATWTGRRRSDAGHPVPASPHTWSFDTGSTECPVDGSTSLWIAPLDEPHASEAERANETLRSLASETRRALDGSHARNEALAADLRQVRNQLADAQKALLERDSEFSATLRTLLDRLEELEPLRHERDAAHRHAIAAEARCRALELRVEHIVMEFPRRLARKIRARLGRRAT